VSTQISSRERTISVSQTAKQLLGQLAERMGVSMASALETVIADRASVEGIVLPRKKTVIPPGGASSAKEVFEIEAEIAAMGETATLAPGADSREAIYGDRG